MRQNSIVAILTLCLATACGKKESISYTTAPVERQNVCTSVTATGTIEPVTKVEVGTQVSGIISHIYVDYNSEVKRGQVIAELDKTNLRSDLTAAQSNLANAQSNLNYQQSNFDRYKALYDKGLVSTDEFESARLAYEQARTQIVVQQQSVTRAQTNLGYATITSPIDGIVLSKVVEEGQTVAASMTTPTLFIIAQDLTDMRVIANVDEADIGGVREGQRVTFAVDAFPDDEFAGRVTQVRREAKTSSNVVTYEVVIAAPNADQKLLPGLTANVTIFTAEHNNVLTIPSKALRFSPNANLIAPDENIVNSDVASPKVWMRNGKTFQARAVKTGLSSGAYTEIVDGLLENEEVITAYEIAGREPQEAQPPVPFMQKRKK